MIIRRRIYHITAGGWALFLVGILLAFGAFNAGLNITYLLASLTLTVFAAGLLAPLWTGGGIRCSRDISNGRAFAREPFPYTITAQSRKRTTARLIRIIDPLGGQNEAGRKLLLRLRPSEACTIPCSGAPLRRGVYPVPNLEWRSGFPFGIAEFGGYFDPRANGAAGKAELIVYPARGTLSQEVLLAARASAQTADNEPRRSLLGFPGEDFRTLREFTSGDNPRRIHWRSSAHRGKLLVRDMERERNSPLLMILDSRVPAGVAAPDKEKCEEALETAISFAAEVCRYAVENGSSVRLAAFFPSPDWIAAAENGGAERRLEKILELLARLAPSDSASALPLIQAAEAAGMPYSKRVLAVTPVAQTADSLREAIGNHAARIFVAAEPDFKDLFRLSVAEGPA